VSCFPYPDRVHVLGNPLREGITEGTREAGIMKFCLDPRLKTLLILGGSQGARRINEAVCDALDSLSAAQSVQVIHQTGLSDIPWVVKRYAEASIVNHVSPFLDDMADALATSDLVLGRAGATTLAEVAAVGRASILVPYPHAADNHQYHNAKAFEDAGAAVLLQDSQLTGETLSRFVADLVNDEERRLGMAEAARGLARTGATKDVCDRIVAIISRRNP
jgi:UDP-N-acetylglucosamine--N-acetylmuramyl-(pentapeptide) pyrophosphoryl-undecaprenol N-acetylglucosamine transferase